jgi:BON domain
MRRVFLGLALAALAMGPLSPARGGEVEDKAAAKEIADLLRESGQIRNYNIAVKYKDGTVRLDGRVTSQEQMNTALMLVSDLDSVDQIVNGLSIGPGPKANKNANGRKRISQAQLASAQRPITRGVPLGMQGGGGAASPAAYQQGMGAGCPTGGCPPGMQGGGMGGYQQGMGGMQGGGGYADSPAGPGGGPMPAYVPSGNMTPPPAAYDQPHMPNYSWPSYAAYPNYAAVTYPKQYSASAWPYIGPFYPYPQVPLGWRKVSLEWDDGWWFLDFDDRGCH